MSKTALRAIVVTAALVAARTEAAVPFMLIHSFSTATTDGVNPVGGLVLDTGGHLYGTTYNGGANNLGTVFTMKSDGTGFSLLHSFSTSAADGEIPPASLVIDPAGNLYGVTQYGGANTACPDGCGTIFKIGKDGTGFTLFHSFSMSSPDDGFQPVGALTLDASTGELYGTTYSGGPACSSATSDCGTLFKIKTDGTGFTLIHAFEDSDVDGFQPEAPPILDGAGNLYGTTSNGGEFGFGTIYRLKTDGSGYALLYSFSDSESDGALPGAALTLDPNGTVLYGTTVVGGASENCQLGCGAVFSINTNGTGFKLLHSFAGPATDGESPTAGLLLDGEGNLVGTTQSGGPVNIGTVFGVKTDGSNFSIAHYFLASASDGNQPFAGLVLDAAGNLFGTSPLGGANGAGTVFEITTGECQIIDASLAGSATICAGSPAPLSVAVSGGAPPYTITLSNGGGSQTGAGPFTFSVSPASTTTYAIQSATAGNGCAVTVSGSATITVTPAIQLDAANLTRPCAGGSTGEITINPSGGIGTLSYSDDGGASFQASRSFAGLPAGTYDVVVKDPAGCSVSQTVTLSDAPAIVLSPTSVSSALQNAAYPPITIEASGGTGTIRLTQTGNLPAGMRFEGGVLSGTPTGIGISTFTITATDANGCSTEVTYTLTVGNPQQALSPVPGPVIGTTAGR